jgi:hypothetical protein
MLCHLDLRQNSIRFPFRSILCYIPYPGHPRGIDQYNYTLWRVRHSYIRGLFNNYFGIKTIQRLKAERVPLARLEPRIFQTQFFKESSRPVFVFLLIWFISRPPLWSSGQRSWLQIRRPGFDSRHYHKKKCSGSGTVCTQPREYKLRSYLIKK